MNNAMNKLNEADSLGDKSATLEMDDVIGEQTFSKPSKVTYIRNRLRKLHDGRLKLVVAALLIVIIIGIALIYHFASKREYEIEVGRNIRFRQDTRQILISNINKKVVLEGKLGALLPNLLPYSCKGVEQTERSVCYGWRTRETNLSMINITYSQTGTTNCYKIEWVTENPHFKHKDCFSMSGAMWYGLGLLKSQKWPLNKHSIPVSPLITGFTSSGVFGSVLERFLLSSNGVAMYVDWNVPFYISVNDSEDNNICLYANYDYSPYKQYDTTPSLKYTVCTDLNILNVQRVAIKALSDPPRSLPDRALFERPVWSTWAYFKNNISQNSLSKYINLITSGQPQSKNISMFIIGDGWEKEYGNLVFDKDRFHSPGPFINDLRRRGIAASAWIHPFKNVDSSFFTDGIVNNAFVRDAGGLVTGLTKWYHGPAGSQLENKIGAATDFSNPSATYWFKKQLDNLKLDSNIQTFQFFGGEVSSLPYKATFFQNFTNPNSYTQAFTELGASYGSHAVITSASGAQNIPIFVMLHNKNATWGYDDGLQTVIPAVLTLGISGYHFVLPPPIGGITFSRYNFNRDKELYIRWLQMTTFLTAMHFSVPPWEFDYETQKIAAEMIDLHLNIVAPLVLEAARDTLKSSVPIIRPLWWIAHYDRTAQVVDDQFLIGNNTLVAPVLQDGARSRDIYLPAGRWRDNLRSQDRVGGWLRGYTVALNEIPYFTRYT